MARMLVTTAEAMQGRLAFDYCCDEEGSVR